MNKIIQGDCRKAISKLSDRSIDLVVTSPPYAQQRKKHYDGIDEADYPQFTADWMEALKPKLKESASVLIVIRTHVKNGWISPYVLKTRMLLHEQGWGEPEELVWHKTNGPPIGAIDRPRRDFEQILWFSLSRRPFVDLRACGKHSKSLGMQGRQSDLFNYSEELKEGTARITDVVRAPITNAHADIKHPAMYPLTLAEFLIKSFSPETATILDPFAGSGTTGVAAKKAGRHFVGIEKKADYIKIIKARLKNAGATLV